MPTSPEEARWFLGQLPHSKGKWAGKPFGVLPWQDKLIADLFKQNTAGERIVKSAYVQTGRKSGKSEIGAALALILLVCEREPGGEVIGAAAKKDQARLILEVAKRMVRYGKINGRRLSDFLTVQRDSIYFEETDSIYRVVAADGEREHGLNPNIIIFDEVHSLGEKRDLWDALETAQGAREHPLTISFTTPGPKKAGFAWDLYHYSKRIMNGEVNDPEFLPVIFEAEKGLAVDDEEAWKQGGPSYPITPSKEWMTRRAKAVVEGRSPEYVFRRLQLGQWTSALERWLPSQKWDSCHRSPAEWPPPDTQVYIGLDAALKRDSFGVSIIWSEPGWIEDEETGLSIPADICHVRVKPFIPEEEGQYIDHEDLRIYVQGLASRFRVEKVFYDPAYMQLIANQLAEAGLPMEVYPQSPERMSMATETFQTLVLTDRMRWYDQELDEQMSNVGVRETDRGVRISKGKSGGRIDCVIAMIMPMQHLFGDDVQNQYFAEMM